MSMPDEIFALTRPVHVEHVQLVVADLDQMSAYYQSVVGLRVIDRSRSGQVLGAGGRALLTLLHRPDAGRAPRTAAGLFHTAFLVPGRAELAHWLAHAAATGVRLDGASDHLVSEALYLTDPEGNGIEIYHDRPPEEWPYNPDGTVAMATDRLDLRELLAYAPQTAWDGMADGTAIGHIHLQVGDVAQAEAFYGGVMGLTVMARYPGASFLASGGYHHHIAANIWNSRGAGPRADNMTGLAGYTLHLNDRQMLDRMTASLDAQQIVTTPGPAGLRLADPWGIAITLTS